MYRGQPQRFEARTDKKTNALTTVQKDNQIAEPCCLRYVRSDEAKRLRKKYENGEIHHGYHEYSELQPREDNKSNTVSTVLKDNPIAEPIVCATCCKDGIRNLVANTIDKKSHG